MRTLLTAVALAAMAMPASAELLIYEGFDSYTVGQSLHARQNPSTGNFWLKSGASPSGDNQSISGAQVNYHGLPLGAGNSLSAPRSSAANNTANRIALPGNPYTRADEDSLFFSFTFRLVQWATISDSGAGNSTHRQGGLVAGFHGAEPDGSNGMGVAGHHGAGVWIRRELDGNGVQTLNYEIGMRQTNASPANIEDVFYAGDSYALNETVFIVGQYQFVDDGTGTGDVARLWINPTPGDLSAEASPTLVAPNSGNMTSDISSFFLWAHTNSPGNNLIDEVRVGTTFESVSAVPEPGTFVLAGLGLAAVGLLRRKR